MKQKSKEFIINAPFVFFEELVTVGEAPTDFVLLTTEQLHLCYIGFLGPPAMIDTKASCPN